MKTRITLLFGLATMLGSSAWAQLALPVTAKVPFDFTMGQNQFKAGEYSFAQFAGGVVRLWSSDRHNSALVMIQTAQRGTEGNPALMFHRYGERYILAEIWGDGTSGVQTSKSPVERELALRAPLQKTRILAATH